MMRSTAFGKITAVYGHIDENGNFARKRTIRKMAITEKSLKIAVLPIILALVRHFMQFKRDFFPASCT